MAEQRYVKKTTPPQVDNEVAKTVGKMPKAGLWIYEIVPGLLQSGEPEAREDWSLVWQLASTVVSVGGDQNPEDIKHVPAGRAYYRWYFEDGEIFPERAKCLASFIADLIDTGEVVLVHCAAGHNRSGFINALTVRELTGCSGLAARIQVQTMRPNALYQSAYAVYLDDLPPLEEPISLPSVTEANSLLLEGMRNADSTDQA